MNSDNVVITTGDMGGRINNKLRESEMFVIIPVQWADSIIDIMAKTPDVKGIYEATRPEDSPYWERQRQKAERAAGSNDQSIQLALEKYGLEISMPWEEEALAAVAKAPKFVRKMAVGNVEDFAEENNHELVTVAVVKAQADSVGMGKFMRHVGGNGSGLLARLFRRDK